jgi:hypothetical protein
MADAASLAPITCLLTIHGIGFQQFPDDDAGVAGYADGLHRALHDQASLTTLLSDDPERSRGRKAAGDQGPVYVQSSWPPDGVRSTEKGLERLGRLLDREARTLQSPLPDLVEPGKTIAHVALVYTPLEETGPDPIATLELTVRGLFSAAHYATLTGGLTMLGRDVKAILHPPAVPPSTPASSANIPRSDLPHREGLLRRLVDHVHGGPAAPGDAGALAVLHSVEDDVAGYFARNVLRERERDFVRQVLLRLQLRGDVGRVVVNSHSQGTVVAFDTLRTLTVPALALVSDWLTLGSPLRKYAEILDWGTDVGAIIQVPHWTNLWDPLDPVADPLRPPAGWRRGDPLPTPGPSGLFQDVDPDTGVAAAHDVKDGQVDNVGNTSSPGLRAHDYWGNVREVVPEIARRLAGQPVQFVDRDGHG